MLLFISVWNYVTMYFVVTIIIIVAVIIMWGELKFIEYILLQEKDFMCMISSHNLTEITQILSSGAEKEIQPFWFQNFCYLFVHL